MVEGQKMVERITYLTEHSSLLIEIVIACMAIWKICINIEDEQRSINITFKAYLLQFRDMLIQIIPLKKKAYHIFDLGDSIKIKCDIPGIPEKCIQVFSEEERIFIYASHKERNCDMEIELPCKIDPDIVNSTYNSGVLEIEYKKQYPKQRKIITI